MCIQLLISQHTIFPECFPNFPLTLWQCLVSRHCGSALAYAPEFQDDREVVEAAVQRNGCSLRYALASLREASWIKDGLVGHKSFSG